VFKCNRRHNLSLSRHDDYRGIIMAAELEVVPNCSTSSQAVAAILYHQSASSAVHPGRHEASRPVGRVRRSGTTATTADTLSRHNSSSSRSEIHHQSFVVLCWRRRTHVAAIKYYSYRHETHAAGTADEALVYVRFLSDRSESIEARRPQHHEERRRSK